MTTFTWGNNEFGQLGDGTNIDSNVPVLVSGSTNFIAITGGIFHSLGVLSEGLVRAWGANYAGQLGDGTLNDSNIPETVTALINAIEVAAGVFHSLALLSNSTVKSWGDNFSGQLGDGTFNNSSVPVSVMGLTNAIAITAGFNHSLALLNDGTIRAWGDNFFGQLGNDTDTTSNVPVTVIGLNNAIAIAAGGGHSLALLSNGTVRAWGENSDGELGDGSNTDRSIPVQVKGTGGSGVLNNVIAIAAGEFHSLALLNDGTVRAWGNNESGQLGDGTNIDSNVPVQVKGTGGSGALNNVVAIAAGGFHSLALLNDGTVRAWGNNESGQLGDGINTDSDIPVTVSGLTNSNIIAGGGDHSLDIQLPPPTIICPANITVSNDPMECGAVVVYPDSIVSDDCPAGFTAVCVPASGTFFPVGTTTVTCTVTDPCGGFAECSFTVTVNDTEPPTITCSDDVAVTVGPGETGAFVTFPNPVVTDNCPSVMFSCTPVSGTFFPVGSTLVTCTATDTAGNAATCSFTVTVTVESIELQCILVQKVYDWVVLTNRDLNKVLIPEECFTLIENCRREGGVVTATCAEVEGTRRCDVLPGPRPAPNVPDGRIVTISFHVRIRIEFFCEGVPLCSFDVPVNFLDDVILCFPQGTDINCTIFDVQCKVLLNEVLGNVVMLEVVMCKDVQVEAEVKIEVEAKFCGPRQPIPIEEQLTVCTFPTFPQQCPDIFPI